MLAGKINCDLAATTGVHTGRDVIKQLLAGAQVVQLCSTLYQNGNEQIGRILQEIQDWMARHQFESLDDFRGRLSQACSSNPRGHERLQYIKLFVGIE
jgi:dihydroorotate dehydrogenase (fumarate)